MFGIIWSESEGMQTRAKGGGGGEIARASLHTGSQQRMHSPLSRLTRRLPLVIPCESCRLSSNLSSARAPPSLTMIGRSEGSLASELTARAASSHST